MMKATLLILASAASTAAFSTVWGVLASSRTNPMGISMSTYAEYIARKQAGAAPLPAAAPATAAGPTYAEYVARQQAAAAPVPDYEPVVAPATATGPTYAEYVAQQQAAAAAPVSDYDPPMEYVPPAPAVFAEEEFVPLSDLTPQGFEYDPWADDSKTVVEINGKMYRVRV